MASFLGFISKPEKGEIDPTVAVSETISTALESGQTRTASAFVEALVEELPVLDGGRYRVAVEAKLNSQALPVWEPLVLSTSISRALINLRAKGALILEAKADASESWILSGRNGPRQDLRFTHVSRPRG